MTKIPQNLDPHHNKGPRRRTQKPVVEKKRRDRINQSLGELRTLLLNYTSDARLQNPKVEKAEILDLAVEYLRNWADRQFDDSTGRSGKVRAGAPGAPGQSGALSSVHTAGFQQCVAQMGSYMLRMAPAQRNSLIEQLRNYMEHHCPDGTGAEPRRRRPSGFGSSASEEAASQLLGATSLGEVSRGSKVKPSALKAQHLSLHTLPYHHEYLSPPPSPFFCAPASAFTTTPPPPPPPLPPFPPFGCHLPFSPRLTPPSPSAYFPTFSGSLPSTPASVGFSPNAPVFHFPSPSSWKSPVPTPREGLLPSVWRPWF